MASCMLQPQSNMGETQRSQICRCSFSTGPQEIVAGRNVFSGQGLGSCKTWSIVAIRRVHRCLNLEITMGSVVSASWLKGSANVGPASPGSITPSFKDKESRIARSPDKVDSQIAEAGATTKVSGRRGSKSVDLMGDKSRVKIAGGARKSCSKFSMSTEAGDAGSPTVRLSGGEGVIGGCKDEAEHLYPSIGTVAGAFRTVLSPDSNRRAKTHF